MSLFRSVALGLAALLVPSLAAGSLIQALDLAELTARAERIVVAQVVSAKSEWDSSGRNIHTRVEIAVEEAWKGSVAVAQRLVIVQPGGIVGDIEMRVHGMPSFAPGEKAVLFLAGQGSPRVVGMSQGKRPVRWNATAKRWVAEAAEHSAVVRRDSQGRLQPAPAEPDMALDDLRQRVRTLVGP
jgi:type II secretory pathway pseudopilin PulG